MKLSTKLGLGLGAIVLLFLYVKWDTKNKTTTIPKGATGIVTTTNTTITTLVKDGDKTTRKTVPNYGHGTNTTIKKDGSITITPNTFGFSQDLGLSTDFRRIGVGLEFIYWKRLSLLGGSNFLDMKTQRPVLNLWVGIGYRIPWSKLNNVSIYTGINTDRQASVGLFLRLGSS